MATVNIMIVELTDNIYNDNIYILLQ